MTLLQYFEKLPFGTEIPGVIKGKKYKYFGLAHYKGKGKFSHLDGEIVIKIESHERKRRKIIRLFFQPLQILVDSKPEEISYGKLPSKYVLLKYANQKPLYPNLEEYYSHYKALAIYLKSNMMVK